MNYKTCLSLAFVIVVFNNLPGQLTNQIDFSNPENYDLVELRLQPSDLVMHGYFYQATIDTLVFLKKAQYIPNKYTVVSVLPENIKTINFPGQSKNDRLLGAVIGGATGMLVGALWATAVDVPACQPQAIFFCSNSEERQKARDKIVTRFISATTLGTLTGLIVGLPVRVQIPIRGDQARYEKKLPDIHMRSIIQ